MRRLWRENPDFADNQYVYALVNMATRVGELDLVFEMLDGIVDEQGFRGYTVAWSPLFAAREDASRLRADSRFAELLRRTGLPDYWREFGWPNGCAADGDDFRCF